MLKRAAILHQVRLRSLIMINVSERVAKRAFHFANQVYASVKAASLYLTLNIFTKFFPQESCCITNQDGRPRGGGGGTGTFRLFW